MRNVNVLGEFYGCLRKMSNAAQFGRHAVSAARAEVGRVVRKGCGCMGIEFCGRTRCSLGKLLFTPRGQCLRPTPWAVPRPKMNNQTAYLEYLIVRCHINEYLNFTYHRQINIRCFCPLRCFSYDTLIAT